MSCPQNLTHPATVPVPVHSQLPMADALNLHDAASINHTTNRRETKEERKARVLAAREIRKAEQKEMKQLELAARKKKLLLDKQSEYEDRALTNEETINLAERGHTAITSGVMQNVDLWYAETQVRKGGFHDTQGKRQRTFDVLGYNQRNIVSEAAAQGHVPALRMMLQVGAATGKSDASGLTALQLALVHGHLDCACLLIMHDNWKEWKHNHQMKKNKKNKKNGLMVEGKEQVREKGPDDTDHTSYQRATDLKVTLPQCKAVLENLLRCPDDVVENGFCAKQSCKMQGFEMVKAKMNAAKLKGENFDAYKWNKNPHEPLIDNKCIAVARTEKMHHVVLVLDGLVRFSRRAFHGLLDVLQHFNSKSVKHVAKALGKVTTIIVKRKRVGVQPTKKGVRNPYHNDLLALHGLLASYLNTPQTPHIYGTVSMGAHVAQLMGSMLHQTKREHPTVWSLECEREYELLMTTVSDDTGCVNQDSFKQGSGLWTNEDERSNPWITDMKRIEREHIKPKIGKGWDANGYVG